MEVITSSERWKSLERESAITFEDPGMCCVKSDECASSKVDANFLATLSWIGWVVGSKVDLCSHPMALELSEKPQNLKPWESSLICRIWIEICIVIMAAMNANRLIENFPIKYGGSLYLHAMPSDENPPIPCSDASDIVKVWG